MGYRYKKYSDVTSAEEMVNKIKNGEISNRNTAYRELVTIASEWEGTPVGNEAQYLIDYEYSDQTNSGYTIL